MNIVDLIKENAMNTFAPPPPPVPTEKCHIVLASTTPHPPLILRFNSVKKGQKAFDELKRVWGVYKKTPSTLRAPSCLHAVDSDMFATVIDLSYMTSISFVDHAIRGKFVPV